MAEHTPPPGGLPDHDRQRILLALAFGVLAMLLGLNLGGRALWTDEVFSLQAGLQPLNVSLADASHPPAYYFLLHYWLRWGNSDAWLRMFSLPWALLAWVLTWLIAGELNLRREGVVAAWLMALSPLVLLYFRLGRYYSLAAAVTLLAIYALIRLLRRPPSLGNALLLAAAVAAVACTDYVSLAMTLLAALLYGAASWRQAEPPVRRLLAGSVLLGLVAAGPVLLRLLHDTGAVAAITPDPLARSLWGALVKLGFPLYSLATGECIDPWRWWVTLPAVALTLALLVVGFVSLWRHGPLSRVTAVLCPLNVLVAVASLSTVAANVPPNRVTSLAMGTVPLAFLTLARATLRLGSTARTVTVLALLGCLYGYGLSNYLTGEQLLNPGYAPPWREVASIIEARERKGDQLLLQDDSLVRYYHGRATVAQPEVLEWIRLGKVLPQGRVWLIARDRGSATLLDEMEQTRRQLLRHGFSEQVFRIMPRTPWEQRMRTLVLRRPAWEAYVKVYLMERRGTGTPRTP